MTRKLWIDQQWPGAPFRVREAVGDEITTVAEFALEEAAQLYIDEHAPQPQVESEGGSTAAAPARKKARDEEEAPVVDPHEAAHIQAHVKVYMVIFAALAALTLITVGASYIHFGSHAWNIGVGLLIALVKGSLVACYFMHLLTERGFVFWVLGLTAGFFMLLLLLPSATDRGNPRIEHSVYVDAAQPGESTGH